MGKIKNKCFRCDGSGEICNICGESLGACQCGDGQEVDMCPDCNGTGK